MADMDEAEFPSFPAINAQPREERTFRHEKNAHYSTIRRQTILSMG